VLHIQIQRQSDDRNGARFIDCQPKHFAAFNFAFLEIGQGFRFEVIHTGQPLEPEFSHGFVGIGPARLYDKNRRGQKLMLAFENLLAIGSSSLMMYVLIFNPQQIGIDLASIQNADPDRLRWVPLIALAIVTSAVLVGRYGGRLLHSLRRRLIGEVAPHPPPTLLD
jgi:hypothetical protein